MDRVQWKVCTWVALKVGFHVKQTRSRGSTTGTDPILQSGIVEVYVVIVTLMIRSSLYPNQHTPKFLKFNHAAFFWLNLFSTFFFLGKWHQVCLKNTAIVEATRPSEMISRPKRAIFGFCTGKKTENFWIKIKKQSFFSAFFFYNNQYSGKQKQL